MTQQTNKEFKNMSSTDDVHNKDIYEQTPEPPPPPSFTHSFSSKHGSDGEL